MQPALKLALLALVVAACSQVTYAQKRTQWNVRAEAKNSLPPIANAAKATVRFYEEKGVINGSVTMKSFNELKGGHFTMAHFHDGNASQSGAPLFWVWPLATKAPSTQPITGSSFKFPFVFNSSQFMPSTRIPTYAAFLTALANKAVYFNAHTVEYPAGLVRGQVEAYTKKDGRRM